MEPETVATEKKPPTAEISIFVYNTHLFGGIFFAEMGFEYHKDEERRREIADRLNSSNYDIVGLCEV
jgi:hypothetical protein